MLKVVDAVLAVLKWLHRTVPQADVLLLLPDPTELCKAVRSTAWLPADLANDGMHSHHPFPAQVDVLQGQFRAANTSSTTAAATLKECRV